ncbi:MAG: DUF1343 domain-containing protein [Cyclobacteriaceae bacterium]|nr:DUF1343 domain-containing protein [Cyclobacteriaceae bacterium]
MIRTLTLLALFCCVQPQRSANIMTGAEQMNEVVRKLTGKRVALVVNHTSLVGKKHLTDTLLRRGIDIKKIFAPEHGFRGEAEAGETVKDGRDTQTGLPVISLYGNLKKPTPEMLQDVDIVVFDIQDVGARFYTYISTMHYVMEACAENGKSLLILDRPNPNGHYTDGPILEPEFKSFVGMHPIPIVHGMTVGELARMINGEGWLEGGRICALEIIPVKNWTHNTPWSLPVKPSPNLPNNQAVALYPSLCLFEGTAISVGRGTPTPFQVIGHPYLKDMPYQFTPTDIRGMATNPPHKDKICYGLDLRTVPVKAALDLSYLLKMYKAFPEKDKFFTGYFEKLAGTKRLREQIQQGMTEEQIKKSWEEGLQQFRRKRSKYLLYP